MVEVTDSKGGDDEITFDWEAGRLLFFSRALVLFPLLRSRCYRPPRE